MNIYVYTAQHGRRQPPEAHIHPLLIPQYSPYTPNGNQREPETTTATITTAVSSRPALDKLQSDHIPRLRLVTTPIASRHTDFQSVLHRCVAVREQNFRYDVDVFRAREGSYFVCGFFEGEHEA